MKYDERILWDCNADLDSDDIYKSDDVYVLNALIKFILTNQSGEFTDFYNTLVNDGHTIPINLANFNTNVFFQKNYCFDFNLDGDVDESDILIYEVFQSWLVSRGNLDLNISELNEFKTYYNSLVKQGIIQSNYLQLNTSPLMLPTKSIESEQYIISTDGKILKLKPGEKIYDESNSQLGSNIDANLMNFMVSDPSVKTFYDWNGAEQPRTWKQTGLCKVLNIQSDELKSVYGIAEPPVDILVNRNLPVNFTPFGTTSLFHGKTIAIYGDKLAVAGTYSDSGVVFIYQYQSDTTDYKLIHEVIVPGDFTSNLPIVEMHEDELFVSNPSISSNPEIFVYDITNPNILTISHHIKLPCPIPVKESGFASCMNINDSGDALIVGNPTQYKTLTGSIDHYSTGEVDYPTGAVFIYLKSNGTWSHSETIFPPDINDYVQKDTNNGADSDIQFGYSVKIVGTTILVGCPRSYSEHKNRRTGCVYMLEANVGKFEYHKKIDLDEVNMNTLNITSGEFKFGLSVTSTDSLNKIWILQNVPGQGTFVGEYEIVNGEYKMKTNSSYYRISSSILNGYVEIGSDNQSVVYGTYNNLYLLDTA